MKVPQCVRCQRAEELARSVQSHLAWVGLVCRLHVGSSPVHNQFRMNLPNLMQYRKSWRITRHKKEPHFQVVTSRLYGRRRRALTRSIPPLECSILCNIAHSAWGAVACQPLGKVERLPWATLKNPR